MPVGTSVQTHCLPLRACFTAAMGITSRVSKLLLWPVAPFTAGLSARCQDGLPLMALRVSISDSVPSGASVLEHIIKLTPAVSFLGKLVREKVNHQLPVALRHFYNKDGLHQSIVRNTCSLTGSGLCLVVLFQDLKPR